MSYPALRLYIDGQWLAHNSISQDGFAVWNRRADGSGDAVRMYSSPGSQMLVSFPRRAHNPILRGVPWQNLPSKLLAPAGGALTLRFA